MLLKTFHSALSSSARQYELLPYKSQVSWGYVWPHSVLLLTCTKVNFEEWGVNQGRGKGKTESQPSFGVLSWRLLSFIAHKIFIRLFEE